MNIEDYKLVLDSFSRAYNNIYALMIKNEVDEPQLLTDISLAYNNMVDSGRVDLRAFATPIFKLYDLLKKDEYQSYMNVMVNTVSYINTDGIVEIGGMQIKLSDYNSIKKASAGTGNLSGKISVGGFKKY